MTFDKWAIKTTSATLVFAIILINSMVTLAASNKIAGEIIIGAKGADVTVNGEVVQSGRSIFSGSTVDTPDNSGATVSLGSLGRLELAPATSVTLTFDDNGIVGTLTTGRVTVVSASTDVTINGTSYGTGQSVDTDTQQTAKTQPANSSSAGNSWWIWAAVFGGAIAGIVLASRTDNNRISLGGGTQVVSPIR